MSPITPLKVLTLFVITMKDIKFNASNAQYTMLTVCYNVYSLLLNCTLSIPYSWTITYDTFQHTSCYFIRSCSVVDRTSPNSVLMHSVKKLSNITMNSLQT